MASQANEKEKLFIDEVGKRVAFSTRIRAMLHSTSIAAGVMLAAAIVALVVANTALYEPFHDFWHTEVGVFFGDAFAGMSLSHIINDIFMAIFFLIVGLEIKYEMTVGELTNIRQALLPIIAAAGGVLAPIAIYLAINASNPETMQGWGVPTATDIAFALGIMALLGNKVPNGIKVFLSTLAVADDIIAILIIAIFYGESPSAFWLIAAAVVVGVLALMNRRHVYSLVPYLLVGAVLWYCVFMSGIHATIAGVLLAFTIPSGSRVNLKTFITWSGDAAKEAGDKLEPDDPLIGQKDYIETVARLSRVASETVPPAVRLEHKLYPWVYFMVLPVFALTNADVSLGGESLFELAQNPAMLGVFFGLLLGKPIGILLASLGVVKLKLAKLPENVTWIHMVGAGILGGVGFTMAIFVANLAFTDQATIDAAKVGILCASFLAGVTGFLFLWIEARRSKNRGVAYVALSNDSVPHSKTDYTAERDNDKVLDAIDSPLVREEIEAARAQGCTVEIAVDLGDDEARSDAQAAEGEEE